MVKEMIAWQLGEDLIDADASLYSQHIKGALNIIADILLQSKLSADKLVSYLQETYPHLLPKNFRIVELPETVISWILSVLQKGTQTAELRKEHKTHKRKHSQNGPTSPLDANLTYSLGVTQQRNKTRSLVDLRTESEIMSLARKLQFNFEDKQFQPPLAMWQRLLDRKVMPIHDKMQSEK